jgi:hypothetical protein
MGYSIQGINGSELFTAVQTALLTDSVGGHPPVVYDQFRDRNRLCNPVDQLLRGRLHSHQRRYLQQPVREQQEALQTEAKWAFEESAARGSTPSRNICRSCPITVLRSSSRPGRSGRFCHACREEVWPQLEDLIAYGRL